MWQGYTEEYYQQIVEQRHNGERIDRTTTSGLLNQNAGGISGGRIPMINNQQQQYLPLINPETRQQMSGMEADYAAATADVRIDTDEEAILHSIIPKYRYQPGIVNKITDQYVIYRTKSGKLAEVEIPNFYTSHAWACASFQPTERFKQLAPNDIMRPKEVLAHTTTRAKNGNFAFGRELNCTYFGTFGTNEDGVEVNADSLHKLDSEEYNTIEIYLQGDEVLLDMFGENGLYQGLPTVGSFIPTHGTAASVRRQRRAFTPINMMTQNLSRPQHPFDSKFRAKKGAEVIEVEVLRDNRGDRKHMPKQQVEFLDRLADNALDKHRKILAIDVAERKAKGPDYPRHPSWQIAVVEAEGRLYGAGELPASHAQEAKIIPSSRPTMNDKTYSYYIRIVTKSVVRATLGHKITGMSGEKAVICAIKPSEEMYKDKWGRVAELNANPAGVSNRNNVSQLIECFKNDACFHTLRYLKTLTNRDNQLSYLAEFYRLSTLETYRTFIQCDRKEQFKHLDRVLEGRIDLVDEIGDPTTTIEIVQMLKDTPYYPPRDVVTFKDADGVVRTSKAKVRVANKYIYKLDKICKYSSACNYSLRQAMGFTAKLGSYAKSTTHISNSASRLIGNTESRALFGNLPADGVKYLLNTGNSTSYGKRQLAKILEGELMVDPDFENDYRSRGAEYFSSLMRTFGHDLKKGE